MSRGPHQKQTQHTAAEQLLAAVFDALWEEYREQVPHATVFEQLLQNESLGLINDHIAFRTLAGSTGDSGISRLSRVFVALGYHFAGAYHFSNKHLSAIHLEHTNPLLPKLFISEFRTWELPGEIREKLTPAFETQPSPLTLEFLGELFSLQSQKPRAEISESMARQVLELFTPPEFQWDETDLKEIHSASQYAAWVAVHGNRVNHFTGLVESNAVNPLGSIERIAEAMTAAGVPMKSDIEGEPGSRLRQTATQAVEVPISVKQQGISATIPWSYAYFEIAERGDIFDPTTGRRQRFEGFLGEQATHLFDMTARPNS